MARPDLTTPEGKRAYARELSRVALRLRAAGLAIVTVAFLLWVWSRFHGHGFLDGTAGLLGTALMGVGWAILIVAIVRRTRYHRARMAEEP